MLRVLIILVSFVQIGLSQANCYKIVGRVIESTDTYTDVSYREKSLRIYYKVPARKNQLPQGVSLQAYVEKSKDSKYMTEYSAVDIPRRSVASSMEQFGAVALTKDGKCLREFK